MKKYRDLPVDNGTCVLEESEFGWLMAVADFEKVTSRLMLEIEKRNQAMIEVLVDLEVERDKAKSEQEWQYHQSKMTILQKSMSTTFPQLLEIITLRELEPTQEVRKE